MTDTPIHELWNLAYEKLRQEDTKLIQEYESKIQEDLTAGFSLILAPNINARERMEIVLRNKMEKIKRDAWRLKFGNSDIQFSAVLPIFSSIASRANEHISNALTVNPPASLAWGGISVLLPVSFVCDPGRKLSVYGKRLIQLSFCLICLNKINHLQKG